MKKRSAIILLAIAIICLAMIVNHVRLRAELTEHLRAHIIPIRTTNANDDFEDLTPLKEIFKDKKIIGMGEATHGTADFFEMKYRMFKFLVEEMDYRIFVTEAQFGAGQVVNDYIVNGKGTLDNCADALMQFTITSNETLEMLQWMKDFNLGKPTKDQIKFYGYDMQMIDENLNQIFPYLQKVASKAISDKKTLSLFLDSFYAQNDQELETFEEEIEHIYGDMISNKSKYINKSTAEEFELMLQNVKVIKQWIIFSNEKNYNKMFDLRDQYAAENIKWISNYEDKKIMLWAHNGHIANSDNKIRLLEVNHTTLGENLKHQFKDDYYSIGFDFYKGSFIAVSPKNKLSVFRLAKSPKDSLSYEMMKTNIPIGFLDINNAKNDKRISDFVSTKIHINSIGASYNGNIVLNPKILNATFDGIIFVNSTTEAKFNPNIIINDGNRELSVSNSFKMFITVVIFIVLLSAYKKRLPTISKAETFDVFGKHLTQKKGHWINNLTVQFSQYIHTISSFKYSLLAIIALSILTVISSLIIPTDFIQGGYSNINLTLLLINVGVSAIIITMSLGIVFLMPLKFLKRIYKEKELEIGLKPILTVLTIGALIYSAIYIALANMFLNISLSMYLLNTMIVFFKGIIIYYSYVFFSCKWEKPFLNIFLMVFFQELLISIINILISIVMLA